MAFVFPLVPHHSPKPTPVPIYPPSITFDDDRVLHYVDSGAGCWQTEVYDLLADGPTEPDEEEQGDFRFKFNPPYDPLHPGHSILSVSGSRNSVTFANLGKRDFDSIRSFKGIRWLRTLKAEAPAVWGLQPGDCIALRIKTDFSNPVIPLATVSEEATDSGAPSPKPTVRPKVHQTTYAKIFIEKLSHDTVRFDYVYQTDGTDHFPPPHRNGADVPCRAKPASRKRRRGPTGQDAMDITRSTIASAIAS